MMVKRTHTHIFLSRNPLCYSCFTGLLEISPVERGVVSIFGVKSGLFVAMNSKGKLYGSVSSNYVIFSDTAFKPVFKKC